MHRYHIFETAAGFCGIAWNGAGVTRFQLPTATAEAAEQDLKRKLRQVAESSPPSPEIAEVVAGAQRYFAGERVDFSHVRVDLGSSQDEFFRSTYTALRRVSWGRTTTYGELARQLGGGFEAARDVGQAMARNPVPLIIPCHRVLAAGGKLGGFSAPGGTKSKARMLELEGVKLSAPDSPQASLGF